jgi:DNA polymerase-2
LAKRFWDLDPATPRKTLQNLSFSLATGIEPGMGLYRGYILTRECMEAKGSHRLRYTGICDQGPFEIVISQNRPLFFIERDTLLPDLFWGVERRQVTLTSFDGKPVDALYFKTQTLLYKARKILQEKGIKTFEADLRPEERFLMERFIQGGIEFQGPCHSTGKILKFMDPKICKAEVHPCFSILSLDIETGQRGELYSIAVHFTGPASSAGKKIKTGIVLMKDDRAPQKNTPQRGVRQVPTEQHPLTGYDHESLPHGGKLFRMSCERDILAAFLDIMTLLDPDIIIGWHVIGFDLVFLEKKYQARGLKFSLGRDQGPPKIREAQKGRFSAHINGRIVIDGPPAMRNAFYSFENFRLETVATQILGIGKEIGEKGDKVAEIERRFLEDKKGLAHYNLVDCILVSDIFEKTGLIDLTFKRAVISGMAMDRVGMSVAAFDHFMLPNIHRKGLVAPNVQDIQSQGHSSGGWVFAKTPGFYEHIVVFDFKSLYPSIIRTFKIDPLSRLKADIHPLNTPVNISFSRKLHVLPDYIATLLDKREQAKKMGDPHLSQAIKILMNSFYGVMGTPGCRFYNPGLPRAITGTGQWILKTTRNFLEQQGYGVIYGDTDSVFVQLNPTQVSDCEGAAKKLAIDMNEFLTKKLTDEFDLASHLEIEFEKHFTRFFLPAIRGGGDGAKKRYVGLVKKNHKEKLVFTGLEFVRSDWTRFAKNFQYNLFHRIFHDQEVTQWIRQVVSEVKNHLHDEDLVYKKRLTKSPKDYVKLVPPHVKAALLLKDKGDNLREIYYVMTLRGPIPMDLPHDDLDYNHYIQKQLKPIADAALLSLDQSFTQIMGGRQMTLF